MNVRTNTWDYGLYQTFAPPREKSGESPSNLPKKDLSVKEKKILFQKLSSLNKTQTEAVFMLICEHARQNDDFDYDPSDLQLPYGLWKKSKTVIFDLEKLPVQLRRILWRFSNVINQSTINQK